MSSLSTYSGNPLLKRNRLPGFETPASPASRARKVAGVRCSTTSMQIPASKRSLRSDTSPTMKLVDVVRRGRRELLHSEEMLDPAGQITGDGVEEESWSAADVEESLDGDARVMHRLRHPGERGTEGPVPRRGKLAGPVVLVVLHEASAGVEPLDGLRLDADRAAPRAERIGMARHLRHPAGRAVPADRTGERHLRSRQRARQSLRAKKITWSWPRSP